MFRLPKSVEVRDDTMREGLQIESKDISVDEKLRLLDALGDTGLEIISIGSFVSPKWTPQMACIDEIAERFVPARDLRSGSSSAQPERRHQYLLLRGPQVRGHPIRHFSRRFGWLPLLPQWQKRWARSNRRLCLPVRRNGCRDGLGPGQADRSRRNRGGSRRTPTLGPRLQGRTAAARRKALPAGHALCRDPPRGLALPKRTDGLRPSDQTLGRRQPAHAIGVRAALYSNEQRRD